MTLTLLPNGNVLLMGGNHQLQEMYNPNTDSWSYTAESIYTHAFHNATLLSNGKVLVTAGGSSVDSDKAELYNPTTDAWTATPDMAEARAKNPGVLLNDGSVLQVSGGYGNETAEKYTPATHSWTSMAAPNVARVNHSVTLLADGNVLVAGGGLLPNNSISTERYDVATNSWVADTPLGIIRADHTATLLANGKVLIVGGRDGNFVGMNSVELYGQEDPILVISHGVGKSGSYFTIWGYGYTPNATATILVNGRDLGTASIDNTGFFNFQFNTTGASNGTYIVTVQVGGSPRPSFLKSPTGAMTEQARLSSFLTQVMPIPGL